MKRFLSLLMVLVLVLSIAAAAAQDTAEPLSSLISTLVPMEPAKTWSDTIEADGFTVHGLFNAFFFPSAEEMLATADRISEYYVSAGYTERRLGADTDAQLSRAYLKDEDAAMVVMDFENLLFFTIEPPENESQLSSGLAYLGLDMPFPDLSAQWGLETYSTPELFTFGQDGVPYAGWLITYVFPSEAESTQAAAWLEETLVNQCGAAAEAWPAGDGLLFRHFTWDGGAFCLMVQQADYLQLIAQDGAYRDFITSDTFTAALPIPSLADRLGYEPASLGTRAVYWDGMSLCGPAYAYAVSEESIQANLAAWFAELSALVESREDMDYVTETLNGSEYYVLLFEGKPALALAVPSGEDGAQLVMVTSAAVTLDASTAP